MSKNNQIYVSPLAARNASERMLRIFSAQRKFSTWRRLWLALAESQRELGLRITQKAITQMRAHLDDIDFARAERYERRFRHDVIAHVHTFGDAAPAARGIIHLGATSCFVGDNTELILMRDAMQVLCGYLANVIDQLGRFARKQRKTATLGFTHFQPAQLTTVGKRACLWCYDFVQDLRELEHRLENLRFRGLKGTTGTQASFLALFDGSDAKVRRLEELVARKMGFGRCEPVTAQTYSRKTDTMIIGSLGTLAGSVHKFCNDLRLLANLKEIEEPFESTQVGSSAMAYKRNPMRSERATGLARFVISLVGSAMQTHAEQWLERTLDDSSNRRLVIPQAFLASDGMLNIILNVASNLVVYDKTIAARIQAELPFMATEEVLIAAVKAGGDRQQLHERIRQHSQAAAAAVKLQGKANDLLERLAGDKAFAKVDLTGLIKPERFIGRAPQQADEFIQQVITPIRRKYRKQLGMQGQLKV